MASGTLTHSDIMQKFYEFKDIAADLYKDEAEQRKYVRTRLKRLLEDEEIRKEKEREEIEATFKERMLQEEERRLAREHELAMKALDQKTLEIRQRYRPQSLELNTTPARQDQETEESKTTTHVPIGYTAKRTQKLLIRMKH
ncbi:hypothetical protein Bpfe_024574 [Biomphalaria pfeifferi]|uniref:Uncharacterized protein n=1 Tax=Biomphalaria pfeifferi TaxID=112525 RepID=A0AAD8EZR7_BIOPF|nr:hypothetical protein Bpfe_024574 [Biomphalaria pfeifferi]